MNRLTINPASLRLTLGENQNRLILGGTGTLRLSLGRQGPTGAPGAGTLDLADHFGILNSASATIDGGLL